ncbi:MAG: metal-dependent hydrolase [Chloroflexi bacterium]|nr:metal-dependent hydrolase [Chloroflexota bacterium]
MPQAGLHGMVGMGVRKWIGGREWFLLGAMLGSFVPDMDNLGVAIATLTKTPTEGIHRTMTHSIFFMLLVVAAFYLIGRLRKDVRWYNLGLGLGLGMLLHALLDLVVWFNGVELFWPLGGEINFWANTVPPEWFMKFMEPAEFLCFGLYLWILGGWARKQNTDGDFQGKLRIWMWLEFALFAVFTPLAYIMTRGYLTVFGALYLFSLFMTFFLTNRMRKTIETAAGR